MRFTFGKVTSDQTGASSGSVNIPKSATKRTVPMEELPEELAGILRGGLTFRTQSAGNEQTIEVLDQQQSVVMSFSSESEIPDELRTAYQQMQRVFRSK